MLRHILNRIIIINFLLGIGYWAYQVFFVIKTDKRGPLFTGSKDMPNDIFLKRRLFAIETRVAMSGLCIYLAILYADKLK